MNWTAKQAEVAGRPAGRPTNQPTKKAAKQPVGLLADAADY